MCKQVSMSLPFAGWCDRGARACFFGRLRLLPPRGVHPVKWTPNRRNPDEAQLPAYSSPNAEPIGEHSGQSLPIPVFNSYPRQAKEVGLPVHKAGLRRACTGETLFPHEGRRLCRVLPVRIREARHGAPQQLFQFQLTLSDLLALQGLRKGWQRRVGHRVRAQFDQFPARQCHYIIRREAPMRTHGRSS